MADFVFAPETSLTDFYRWLSAHPEQLDGDKPLVVAPMGIRTIQARQLASFLRFSRASKQRLSGKMAEYNTALCKEKEPHLRQNLAQFARMNQGGKYIRGTLVNLGYSLFQDFDVEYSDDLALAFELFQTGILIHDDIIDHASLRRGVPTIPTQYLKEWKDKQVEETPLVRDMANAMAICSGDLGMYFANQKITEAYLKDARLGQVLHYFNDVVLRTIRGEVIDVILPFEEQNFPAEGDLTASVTEIYRLKTAWYTVIGPLCLGALLAGADEAAVSALETFAEDLGIAFQMKDDLLSIFASDAELGKAGASDIAEYKQTLLYAYLRSQGGAAWKELLRYYGKPNLSAEDVAQVRRIFEDSGAKAYMEAAMNHRFEQAVAHLREMTMLPEDKKQELYGLILYLNVRQT